jgi:DNA repair exonuclease SbcCD ATPase subunit
MSFGQVPTQILLDCEGLTLILGENRDVVGSDQTVSRNGVGKSSILNAISFALYGEALAAIRRDNLVNKINGRACEVSLTFSKNGTEYRIERGRKPAYLRFFKNGCVVSSDESVTDATRGEMSKTQEEIQRVVGFSYEVFREIVGLNTYSQPLLSLPAKDQRAILEEILEIAILGKRADILREMIRREETALKELDMKISAGRSANDRIYSAISQIKIQAQRWEEERIKNISSLKETLALLREIDYEAEQSKYAAIRERKAAQAALEAAEGALRAAKREHSRLQSDLEKVLYQINKIESSVCPTCGQSLKKEKKNKILQEIENNRLRISADLESAEFAIKQAEGEYFTVAEKLKNIPIVEAPLFADEKELFEAKTQQQSLLALISAEETKENPHLGQEEILRSQILDLTEMIEEKKYVEKLLSHEKALLKLLTDKNSFVRTGIINQNLSFLNNRLSYYAKKIGLPHELSLQSNLEIDISLFGQSYDFDNLSRGERTRLMLALNFALRDIYEIFNGPINLLFLDEIIDGGLDSLGVSLCIDLLRDFSKIKHRSIFLVSHREEAAQIITNQLFLIKSNGFTSLAS